MPGQAERQMATDKTVAICCISDLLIFLIFLLLALFVAVQNLM